MQEPGHSSRVNTMEEELQFKIKNHVSTRKLSYNLAMNKFGLEIKKCI